METKEKSSVGQSDNKETGLNPPFNSKFPTGGALIFGALGRENAKNDCLFCDRSYSLDSCKIVPTIDQRLKFLRNQKRCFKCFKKGHVKVLLLKEALFLVQWKHHLVLCKSTGIDSYKSSGIDPTKKKKSKRNPEKEYLTIPGGPTLFGSMHPSQDTILLRTCGHCCRFEKLPRRPSICQWITVHIYLSRFSYQDWSSTIQEKRN